MSTRPNIKDFFVSRYGDRGLIVEVDCKQVEVAALAEITNCKTLIDEINDGEDIHKHNAGLWLKKPPSEVTDKEKKQAKVMTFQLQYGASPKAMAKTLGLSESACRDFVESYLIKYPEIWHLFNNLRAWRNAHATTVQPVNENVLIPVDTPTGTSYYASYYKSDFTGMYSPSLTQAKNYPVQGFATGDMVPLMNLLINSKLEGASGIIPCNGVHDSFVFDCHGDQLGYLILTVHEAFAKLNSTFKELFHYDLKVDYSYSVEIGETWSTNTKFSREEVVKMFREQLNGT